MKPEISIQQQLTRIEKQISILSAKVSKLMETIGETEQTKPVWVKGSYIKQVTGWNDAGMRKARYNSLLEFKNPRKGVIDYNLSSLPEQFIKKSNPRNA